MKKLFLLLLVLTSLHAKAQLDFHKQYRNGRDLFNEGKFNLAMETFKPLIAYDRKNPYAEYASLYYSIAAYNQNYKSVAKDMLLQIKSVYPQWEKMDEVNYWLGRIHFDNANYFQGLKTFAAIRDRKMQKDVDAAKAPIRSVTDVETLRMMHEEYPDDAVIGESLAILLARNPAPGNDEEIEKLVKKFNLKRSQFIPETPKTVLKEKYSVSLLMPFMITSLEPTPAKKRNQIVLDFYEGLKLAADTLTNISVRAYDIDRNMDYLRRLLETEELKTTDLIVGPFFPEENKIVQEFSQARKINIVHPFSNSLDIIGGNPHAMLFQPSAETLGRKSAEFLASRVTRKNCMVFYGPTKKDSALAVSFAQTATEKGLNVVLSQKITRDDAGKILEILATPTEFDEFKYPSQFTLKKDSIGSIYVASDDALIYAKVVTGIETRADSIKVVGSESWLDDSTIDPEKFQTLKIALTAPNYTSLSDIDYKVFFRKFARTYGRAPSDFARMGYEFMVFFGDQLRRNGVYFQERLAKEGVVPGVLFTGFDYTQSRDNALVPFVSVRDGELTLIDKR